MYPTMIYIVENQWNGEEFITWSLVKGNQHKGLASSIVFINFLTHAEEASLSRVFVWICFWTSGWCVEMY